MINQKGVTPLLLVLFAGFWIVFSITFLDKWYFKFNRPFLAERPVVTSQYLATIQDEIDITCTHPEDVDCGDSENEGDSVDPQTLASAD